MWKVYHCWDPHQQGHINSLEKVQKFALKVWKWNMDYNSRLNFCKLPTLVSRRHYLKLSFLYQVIHGSFTFPNAPLERRFIPSNLRSTASSFLLQRPRTHTNAYQYSFFPHVIALWNNLPSSLHSSISLQSFKRNYNMLFRSLSLTYCLLL